MTPSRDTHKHKFIQYRDGRPPVCECGAWQRTVTEVVTDEPRPDPLRDRERATPC